MPDFVTPRELAAHLDPIKDDISEIKADVKTLVNAQYQSSFFGGRGHALFLAVIPAVISGLIALLITLFL